MQAPACSKNLQKPVYATNNASQKYLRKLAQLVRATLKEEGSVRLNAKQAKRFTMTGDKILHNNIPMDHNELTQRKHTA
eukprot:10553732-Ditylum_brightwellii.AAC.2